MAQKIAKADRDAMNSLFAGEVDRMGGAKVAGEKEIDAFKDHEEYLDTLDSVMSEDNKQSFDPNDVVMD